MTRFAIIALDNLPEQIADNITTQLKSKDLSLVRLRKFADIDVVEGFDFVEEKSEVMNIARNVAAPLSMCEVDFDDAQARLVDMLRMHAPGATIDHDDASKRAARILESLFTVTR